MRIPMSLQCLHCSKALRDVIEALLLNLFYDLLKIHFHLLTFPACLTCFFIGHPANILSDPSTRCCSPVARWTNALLLLQLCNGLIVAFERWRCLDTSTC